MKNNISFILLPFLIFNLSCNGGIGKGGKYTDIAGKATIKEIKTAVNATCPDAVDVLFDFTPDDPNAVKNYNYPNIADKDAQMFNNLRPAKAWVEKKGIKVGNVYPAKRSEMIPGTGTSAPVGLEITDKSVTDVSDPDFCK